MRLIFALLLLSFAIPSLGYEGKDQPKSSNTGGESNAQTPDPAQVSSVLKKTSTPIATGETEKNQADTAPKPEPFMSHSEWIMSGLTAVYVILTGIYVWYSRKTLQELQRQIGLIEKQEIATERQIELAQASADAALLNAKAVINAERPWLLPRMAGNTLIGFKFNVRNVGKTPAKITWLNPIIHNALLPLGEYPAYPPNYGYGFDEDGSLVNAKWVAPGDEETIGIFDSFEIFDNWDSNLGGFSGGRERIFLFSAIKYMGTFNDDVYQTRFCYRLGSGILQMDGAPGYNDCT